MKVITKNILLSTALTGVLIIGSHQELRATEANIFPITNQMVNSIDKATTPAAAQEALCKQGGDVRGSGSTAGNLCLKQDFARIARILCNDYAAFKDSKCDQNAIKQQITDVQKAADAVKALLQAKVSYETNVGRLICGPKEWDPARLASYRAKLPPVVKKIADESCGGQVAPARPAASAPPLPKETAQKIVKEDVAYMEELRRVLQEGPKLKPVRGRLNSVATQVPVEGKQISIPAFTIPAPATEDQKKTLLQAAGDLKNALSAMNKAIEQGETVSQPDIDQVAKIKESVEKAQTSQEAEQKIKQATNEIVQYSRKNAQMQKILEQMRQGS